MALALIAAIFGVLAIVVPTWVLPTGHYEAPLFPAFRAGFEQMGPLTLILLGVAGAIPGWLARRHGWRLGLAVVGLFPLITFAETVVDPTSHNLWPLEIVIQGMLAIPAMVGAGIGAWLGVRFRPKAA